MVVEQVVSDVRRERRRAVVASAQHSIEMEGGRVDAATRADQALYVEGELSLGDLEFRSRARWDGEDGLRPPAGG